MSANTSSTKWPPQVFDMAEFAKLGQEQSQALTEAQKEWTRLFQQANDDWRDRIALERNMAAELTGELTAARTLPDAAAAYQKWMARHFELMAKDSQKLMDSSQTFAASMSRLLPYRAGRNSGA
jgi:hypothetical protein